MEIFSSKDFSAPKSNRIRAAFGKELDLGVDATNNQVEQWINAKLIEVTRKQEDAAAIAALPPNDMS